MIREVGIMKSLHILLLIVLVTGCAQNIESSSGASQWDFDHQVQFKQTELSDDRHHIQVISKQDTEFSMLATFLMRRALMVCKSYGFKIEVLKGVERFDDKLSFPNMIMPSLSANIECPKR